MRFTAKVFILLPETQTPSGGTTVPGRSSKAAAVRSRLPGSGRSVVADNRRNPRSRFAKDSEDKYIILQEMENSDYFIAF